MIVHPLELLFLLPPISPTSPRTYTHSRNHLFIVANNRPSPKITVSPIFYSGYHRLLLVQRPILIIINHCAETMGGKIWSEAEEKYFWRTAVSWSPKRAGIDTTKPERSWDQLAIDMQASMGDAARRQYSGGLLCKISPLFLPVIWISLWMPSSYLRADTNGGVVVDHWNQNVNSQRRSPNAGIYLQEYKTKRSR